MFWILLRKRGLDPDTMAYIDAMALTPSDGAIRLFDEFIKGCKKDASDRGTTNNWQEIALARCYTNESQQASRLCINNPSFAECSEVSSPTWTEKLGYTFDGAASYLNQNWNGSTHGGGIYQQNDAGLFVYSLTEVQSNGQICGAMNASILGSTMTIRNTSNFARVQVNSSLSGTIGSNTSVGLFHAKKTVAGTIEFGRNGVSTHTAVSVTGIALSSLNHYTGCANSNGTAANFWPGTVAFEAKTSGYINEARLWFRVDKLITGLRDI